MNGLLLVMEWTKNFFTLENSKALLLKFYEWFQDFLIKVFGKIQYEPIRDLLSNPWFWIILIVLFIIGRIFRRR